ncbi:hypothetical protein P8H27_18120 [Pseudomonas sp. sp1636]|uniref:TlpA family protein disulfide reductase n=1 Tax=Pseudomonas sp. sp1636 TaxID=3036707 RepID=UPI0025A4F1B9|nr:hypothetical protein [Pseudomonas sp. sp1636]MDM8350797.1 hypothetical protein [Pseudomonas sp. sp1636]
MTRFVSRCLYSLCLLAGLACAQPSIEPLNKEQARLLVDPGQYRQPTLLALWSLECAYCKKNLAQFGELLRQHPGIQLITLASEPVASGHAELLEKLAVPGRHFAYGSEAPEALAFAIDPSWRGELPRTLLFDGQGGRHALSGVIEAQRALQLLGLE